LGLGSRETPDAERAAPGDHHAVNRKTILLALLVAACVPCAAALAARPERFKADAFDVSVEVSGSYSGASTGGPPDDYVERHQRVQFNYAAKFPKVWFPVNDVPPDHGTEWFGRRQKIAASFSNTGFNVIGAQRSDVNCAGRMTTDLRTPIMFWDNHRTRFSLELHPILNLLFTDDCAEPFSINGADTEVNLRVTHSDLGHRTVTKVARPSRDQRRPRDLFYCLTVGMTPHTCEQSLGYTATVTLKRVCSARHGGHLDFVPGGGDVYTYAGKCGDR
jgi:hypothetical protein